MTICTRFAPSPTGHLHIGGVRTALFSWLHARKHGGEFILRIEDTDRERSTDASVSAILEGMAWLGLDYDQGPYYQTQRFDRYKTVLQQLLDTDNAYYCYCSKQELENMRAEQMARKEKPRYDERCRQRTEPVKDIQPVVRFKNPQTGTVVVNDLIRGKVVFSNTELDDLIIARSDGTPTYNFTVVVDDQDMGITHVIRGDDHLNNTPRQINILQALGASVPAYAHVPMILGEDGKRLSKRTGAVSVMQYQQQGYLPEALLNFLVRLGWSHGDQEIFSVDEMIELFDIKDVNHAASVFNPAKLLWLNQHYIMTSPPEHVAQHLEGYLQARGADLSTGSDLTQIVLAQRERAKTLVEMADNSLFFFNDFSDYHAKAATKHLNLQAQAPLEMLRERFAGLTNWQQQTLHEIVMDTAVALDLKMGKVAQPLRVAISGGPVSPPIDVTVQLLGRQRTLDRIDKALTYIEKMNSA